MTTAQEEALDKITELMREHLDAAVLVFETDSGKDLSMLDLSYRRCGTFSQALGLLEYGKHRLLSEDREVGD